MTARWTLVAIILIGISLPYIARLPGGIDWVKQYANISIGGWLFLGAFNAIAWGAVLALIKHYRHPAPIALPALFGFAFLAWAHSTVDLREDAQAAIALIFIPILALIPIAIGGVLGYFLDQWLQRGEKLR